jgi:hypothetical protein
VGSRPHIVAAAEVIDATTCLELASTAAPGPQLKLADDIVAFDVSDRSSSPMRSCSLSRTTARSGRS